MSESTSMSAEATPSFSAKVPWPWLHRAAVAGGIAASAYGIALSKTGVDSPRFEFASGLLSAAAFLYLLAFAFYLTHLARGRDLAAQVASLLTWIGAACHVSGMLVRWTISGWLQPPWTNLYESLLFFALGIVIVYLIFEWRSQSRVAGVFVLPAAMIMMGLAAFSLPASKEIPQIMPALQSRWIQIHVTFASVAYAGFMTAFGFAILYLIKDRLPAAFMSAVYAGFAAITFLSFGLGDVLLHAEFPLKAPTIIGTGELVTYGKPVPYAGQLFLVSFLLYVTCIVFYILGKRGREVEQYIGPAFIGAFVAHTGGMAAGFWHAVRTHPIPMQPQMTLLTYDVNAYIMGVVVLTWIGSLLMLLISWRGEQLAEALPKKEVLDDWSYKAILVGLPLMALNLITGAIWANNAWGSYWSWDPKETWALITFLTYAAYIHARIARGWSGRKASVLALLGFGVVLFTYLGVNLFLSGLHSYGSPN